MMAILLTYFTLYYVFVSELHFSFSLYALLQTVIKFFLLDWFHPTPKSKKKSILLCVVFVAAVPHCVSDEGRCWVNGLKWLGLMFVKITSLEIQSN